MRPCIACTHDTLLRPYSTTSVTHTFRYIGGGLHEQRVQRVRGPPQRRRWRQCTGWLGSWRAYYTHTINTHTHTHASPRPRCITDNRSRNQYQPSWPSPAPGRSAAVGRVSDDGLKASWTAGGAREKSYRRMVTYNTTAKIRTIVGVLAEGGDHEV